MKHRSLTFLLLASFGVAVLAALGCQDVSSGSPTAEVTRDTAAATSTDVPATSVSPSPTQPAKPTEVPLGSGKLATPVVTATTVSRPDLGSSTSGRDITGTTEAQAAQFEYLRGGQLQDQNGIALGLLVPADESFDSVCNVVGEHGSPFGVASVFNSASEYGGPFGAKSPFNPMANGAPQVFVNNQFAATFSVSEFTTEPVNPYDVLNWLGCPFDPV